MSARSLDSGHLRSCLSRFVTGVAVVSYERDDELRGLTVNSFTSVSLDPPLVLISLARTAKAAAQLAEGPFTINVLKASQLDIALQFAGRPRSVRPVWRASEHGLAPSLDGALATFWCRPWRAYDGGDHLLQLGEVVGAQVTDDPEPLLFDRGQFALVGLPVLDHPRVIDAAPVTGSGLAHSHLIHHLAG